MKIIYLHQYFNTPKMSGGVRSYDIATHLVKKGHKVHMITSSRDTIAKNEWIQSNENGISTNWFSIEYSNQLNFIRRLKAFFLFAFHAAKKGLEFDGDVVFASSTPLTIAIPAVYIARKKSIPLVFEVRDLWPDVPIAIGVLKNFFVKFMARSLEHFAYKNSQAIIALSDGMKEGIIDKGYDENKVTVVQNFSNTELFNHKRSGESYRSKKKWLGDSPLIVYTGTFGIINGVTYLVDIAEQLLLLNSDIKILLIGSGKEFDLVYSSAKYKSVLNINLFIESSVNKEQLPEVLAAANLSSNIVIDVPAVWNNSANKFFDALASGTPVLLNGGGWQSELINKHRAGIVTHGLSIDLAAKKIDNFLHDETLLNRASNNAFNLSKELFDKDKLVIKIEEILKSSVINNQ
jgi:glycosyltransferase involved in cell wall biosynthesis